MPAKDETTDLDGEVREGRNAESSASLRAEVGLARWLDHLAWFLLCCADLRLGLQLIARDMRQSTRVRRGSNGR